MMDPKLFTDTLAIPYRLRLRLFVEAGEDKMADDYYAFGYRQYWNRWLNQFVGRSFSGWTPDYLSQTGWLAEYWDRLIEEDPYRPVDLVSYLRRFVRGL